MWLGGPYAESAWTQIPGATDISWDGFKRGVRNPTNLQSIVVQKKPGMPDLGQIKCKVFYDPNEDTHQSIVNNLLESAAVASAETDQFQITFADGMTTSSTMAFEGFVSEFSIQAEDPETGTLTANMTVELYNLTDFTPGTP